MTFSTSTEILDPRFSEPFHLVCGEESEAARTVVVRLERDGLEGLGAGTSRTA